MWVRGEGWYTPECMPAFAEPGFTIHWVTNNPQYRTIRWVRVTREEYEGEQEDDEELEDDDDEED